MGSEPPNRTPGRVTAAPSSDRPDTRGVVPRDSRPLYSDRCAALPHACAASPATTTTGFAEFQCRQFAEGTIVLMVTASSNPGDSSAPSPWKPRVRLQMALFVTVALILATVGQLALATFVSGLPQFEGKAFGSRLVFYPLLMSAPILAWWLTVRRRPAHRPLPWAGFACVAAPFFIDVTGNSVNLYDSVVWWDDANHFVNWLLLSFGIGLMLTRTGLHQRWALAGLVTGMGAVLAICWELGEWFTFIRHGTELDTAYTDTLGDEALGTLGAAVAGALLARVRRRSTRQEDRPEISPSSAPGRA